MLFFYTLNRLVYRSVCHCASTTSRVTRFLSGDFVPLAVNAPHPTTLAEHLLHRLLNGIALGGVSVEDDQTVAEPLDELGNPFSLSDGGTGFSQVMNIGAWVIQELAIQCAMALWVLVDITYQFIALPYS